MQNGSEGDVQALINTTPFPPIKVKLKEEIAINIIKVKMWRNLTLDRSDTYDINMSIFKDCQPEEFLMLLKKLRIAIYGTGTMSPYGRIDYLWMMLNREALRNFNELPSQNNVTKTLPLESYQGGFTRVFTPDQCTIQAKVCNA